MNTVLVPASGSDRRETATLLLAMAREKGIDTSEIKSVYNGYEVPAELLGVEDEAVLVPETQDTEDGITVKEPKRRGRPPGSKNAPRSEAQDQPTPGALPVG